MSIAMLLKIFSDCCIGFAILASGPVPFDIPLLIPALICGASAALATYFEEKGWTALRRLCALLPFCGLLMAGVWQQMLILAVPAVYTALVILRNKLELEYYAYRHFFIRSLVLLGCVYLIANAWIYLAQIADDPQPMLVPGVVLRYSLVHLLCGVVLQRKLRLGIGRSAESGKKQMVTVLGVAATIVGGFVLAEPLLRNGIGALMKALITLLFAPWVLLFELVAWVISQLEPKGAKGENFDKFAQHMDNAMLRIEQIYGQQEEAAPSEEGIDFSTIWAIAVCVVLLIVAVLLLRSFHKRSADTDPGALSNRLAIEPKKKNPPPLSNRGRVRQLYREFLRAEKKLGMKLKISDTSGDVLEHIHQNTDRSSADALRQVYLAARYDDRQGISRSQVERAKRALKGTRRAKE